jgi:hypothetical protein
MNLPKLDLLVELGGEDPVKRPRSNKVIEIYHSQKSLSVIVTGSHSGLIGPTLPEGIKPEHQEVSEYLISNGVNPELIKTEEKSLDTLGNLYLLRKGRFIQEGSRAGLITDEFHMPRGAYCAEKVYGDSVEFFPIVAERDVSPKDKMTEKFYTTLMKLDLRKIKNGDFEAITYFMEHNHPYYAKEYWKNEKFSWQGLVISLLRKMNKDKVASFAKCISPTLKNKNQIFLNSNL